MVVLSAFVALLFVLLVLNLVLTAAMIRRMRDWERESAGARFSPGGPAVGAPVPEFRVQGHEGTVDHRALHGERALIAFLSSECDPCRRIAPTLTADITRLTAGGVRTLVAVKHLPGQSTAVLDALAPERPDRSGAVVVAERPDTPGLFSAFRPAATPAFFLVDADGTVTAKGLDLDTVLATTADPR